MGPRPGCGWSGLTEYFKAEGWSVKDVGANESFDLLLSRGDERCRAEVKGTTSAGTDVILTRAEVETQRKYYPHNALVVVHSIKLDRTGPEPTTSGGVLHCTSPWAVHDEDLSVISYAYRTRVGASAPREKHPSSRETLPAVPAQRQTAGGPELPVVDM